MTTQEITNKIAALEALKSTVPAKRFLVIIEMEKLILSYAKILYERTNDNNARP